MIISVYTTALLLLLAVPFSDAKYDRNCHFNSVGSQFKPQSERDSGNSWIERGNGIISEEWWFGLTKSGELRLYREDKEFCDSGEHNVDLWVVNEYGSFACYKGSCLKQKGMAIYDLNCGGYNGSYIEIDTNYWYVLKKKYDKKNLVITKEMDEVGNWVSS